VSTSFRKHLVEHILTGLALYQSLLAEGLAQETARGVIDRTFETQIQSKFGDRHISFPKFRNGLVEVTAGELGKGVACHGIFIFALL
jgi:hypothetical protein